MSPSGTFDANDVVHRVLWSDGSSCRDSLVVGFRGSLEIHSVIEGENEALNSSFDHYEASLMDEDNLWYDQSHAVDGSIEKYKARFVARGLSQKEGIDYEETFAPVTKYTSIRAIMALTAKLGWKLHQMDMKTNFLNVVVEEEVYKEQPLGFETHDWQSHVCRLNKALYNLKRVPRT